MTCWEMNNARKLRDREEDKKQENMMHN